MFHSWYERQSFPCLLGGSWADRRLAWLDLRRAQGPFADPDCVTDTDKFADAINQLLRAAGADVGLGGYAEERPFYITPVFAQTTPDGTIRYRSLHLGLDVWAPAGTPLYATLAGEVHGLADNANERDYGPTLILRHEPIPGLTFYSLYGHLDGEVLQRLKPGQPLVPGDLLAHIGDRPGNGNWPPHLHLQIILDPLHHVGDFPGVAFPEERDYWLRLCPDPARFAGIA